MKIYSWNIFFRNQRFDEALRFIVDLDFDVLCLQEVPEDFLARLKKLPCSIAYGPDASRSSKEKTVQDFLVILSRHAITNHAAFPMPSASSRIPLRTRLFMSVMRPFGWSTTHDHGGMWADIAPPGAVAMRVCNLHLTLAYPSVRAEEFEWAMRQLKPSVRTIVCGDFNILESARIAILNWILGGSLMGSFAWKRERHQMQRRFQRYGFKNPLHKTKTHALSASQLDHILVPHDARVTNARVHEDPLGSDHHPVCVEVSCGPMKG